VDNRCRCKSPQTSEGGQPLVAVTLCRLVAKGLREPVGAQAISFPPGSPQAPVAIARRQIRRPDRRCDAFSRAAIRDRGLEGAGTASAQIHARPGTSSASHQGRVNVAGCRQRCRLEIGHEFDMRFTSEAARFGSLVLPATSPLTASMPSTVGLGADPPGGWQIGPPHPPLTATVRADW